MNRYKFIISLLLVLTMWSACKEEKSDIEINAIEADDGQICITEKQISNSGYLLGKMNELQFSQRLSVYGKIHLPEKNKAVVSTYVDGMVSGFNIIEGERVKKGQYLFSLTGPEILNLQDDYLTMQSRISYLKYEQERQAKLSADNITTQKELAKIEESLQSMLASFQVVKSKMDLIGINSENLNSKEIKKSINIYAPITGIVSAIAIVKGGHLHAGVTALELFDPEHLHLELMTYEKEGSKLKIGQKVMFSTSSMPDTKYEAEIYLIDKKVDDHRLIAIHCHFEDALNDLFFPGMYASGEILIGEHSSWSLPEKAFVQKEYGMSVLRLASKVNGIYCFEEISIDVGLTQNGNTELKTVSSDLTDAQFLVDGAYYITE